MNEKQSRIIADLKSFYETHNRTPRTSDFSNDTTIMRHFGTWNAALTAAGLPLNAVIGETKNLHCNKCGKSIRRIASSIRGEVYCSHTCSASFNNTKRKSRRREYFCVVCNTEVEKRRKWCKECSPLGKENMSISSLFYIKKAAGKYSKIRQKARSKYLASKPHECIVCGYTLHIEVAHIKPISSFPEDTLVSVVNHFDNLAGLCKRCHWEYDNGHVEIMVGAPRIELGT